MSLLQYLFTVIKINFLVLGGASLTAPFYYQYYVNKDFIPEQEINHYLTMANILPGAMSIYMTAYTGLYLHGKKGMYFGILVLFVPIILISIILFEIVNILPFDISMLIYISLPIMIVASIDYIISVFKSELSPLTKYGIFFLSMLLLSLSILGTIQIILVYIFIILILNRGLKHA
ncbi:chromate transporter [Mollicutes bacterium LVI A0039]|nr:chromate transporter [Mollicutes bacterium LVI A0039]